MTLVELKGCCYFSYMWFSFFPPFYVYFPSSCCWWNRQQGSSWATHAFVYLYLSPPPSLKIDVKFSRQKRVSFRAKTDVSRLRSWADGLLGHRRRAGRAERTPFDAERRRIFCSRQNWRLTRTQLAGVGRCRSRPWWSSVRTHKHPQAFVRIFYRWNCQVTYPDGATRRGLNSNLL